MFWSIACVYVTSAILAAILQEGDRGGELISMAIKRKHSNAEIASKLAQADQMSAQGKLQVDIARALNVSVMTLHRWRKLSLEPPRALSTEEQIDNQFPPDQSQSDRIAELQLEN